MRNIKNYIVRYIFWTLSRIFVYVYIRPKFNIADDTNYDPVPKPPFIMISNHATFFDPWIVGHHSNRPIAIMNNEDAFHAPWVIRWYLKNIGTFPKKKGWCRLQGNENDPKEAEARLPGAYLSRGPDNLGWRDPTDLLGY